MKTIKQICFLLKYVMQMKASIGEYNMKIPDTTENIMLEETLDPFYFEANMERLRNAIKDAKAGKKMTEHEFIEVDDD